MDKKITDLSLATAINNTDVGVLVNNGTDYQFAFSTLLQFISSSLSVGAQISFGNTLPQNNTGKNGDVFINTSTASFAQKMSGTWAVVYTLASAGSTTDGTVLYGMGEPASSTGNNNDTYIDTGTGIFYKKTSGSWAQVFSMQTGPAGVKGDKGDAGSAGINGKTILNGTSNPSNSSGTDGDYYIDTSNYTFFGPKTGGIWGAGVELVQDVDKTYVDTQDLHYQSLAEDPSNIVQTSAYRFVTDSDKSNWNGKEPAITAGTAYQFWRGDKTWQTLDTLTVPENTNLYYTAARFNSAFAGKTSGDLAEGSNLYYTDTRVQTYGDGRYLQYTGGTMTGDLQLPSSPANGNSAVTKGYVDNLFTGLTWKQEVRASTTTNITLSGTQTVDGVALVADDRCLVKNQTVAADNGIYQVNAGSWTRTADADTTAEIEAATVLVRLGTVNKNTQWTNANSNEPVIGTDAITFAQISGAGTYTNGTGLSLTGNVFSIDATYTASSSATGYLSATDWSTFNGKQNAIGYTTANDSAVVHNTGSETIAGDKTFSGRIWSPGPSGNTGLLYGTGLYGYGWSTLTLDQDVQLTANRTLTLISDNAGGTSPNSYVFSAGTITRTTDSKKVLWQGDSLPSTSISITGTGGSGYIDLLAQSSVPATPASSHQYIYADANGRFTIVGSNGFAASLSKTNLTASRVFKFTDLDGTLPLLEAAQTFTALQTTSLNAATLQTSPTGTVAMFGNADNSKSFVTVDSYGTSIWSSVYLRSARGTAASPAAIQTNDILGQIEANGYNGSGYPTGTCPIINAIAVEDWSSTASGTGSIFYNRLIGTNQNNVAIRTVNSQLSIQYLGLNPQANFEVNQGGRWPGTISTIATTGTVTGVNTQFTNHFRVGQTITANGETRTISAIASNTSLTTDNWTNTNTTITYTSGLGTLFSVFGNGKVSVGTPTSATTYQNRFSVTDNTTTGGLIGFQNTNSAGYSDIHFYDNTGAIGGSVGYANSGSGLGLSTFIHSNSGNPIIFSSNSVEVGRFGTNRGFAVGNLSSEPIANFQVYQSSTPKGTVSTIGGTGTVTGVGTQFTNKFRVGSTITVLGETRTVSAITSDTSMTTDNWTGTITGVGYNVTAFTPFAVYGNGNVNVSSRLSIGGINPTIEPLYVTSNVIAALVRYQNTNIAGYTSFDLFDYNGTKQMTFGYANPSATVAGTNTVGYINMATANPIIFGINAVEKMRVTNTGVNIGGTSAPTASLKMESAAGSNCVATIQNTSASGYTSMDYYGSDSTKRFTMGWANASVAVGTTSVNFLDGVNGDPITFRITSTEKMRVSSTAFTTTAIPVTPTFTALGTTTSDGIILQNTTAAANNAQQISPSLRLSSNGWGTTGGTSQSTDWRIYSLPTQGSVPSIQLNFDSSVGGGSFNTRASLTSGSIMSANTFGSFRSGFGAASGDGLYCQNFTAATSGTTVQNPTRLRFSGNAWNTSASVTLDVLNELRLTTAATPTSALYWAFQSNGGGYVDQMLLTNTGRLGLNTASPAYRLDVKGTATTDAINADIGYNINQLTTPSAPTLALVASAGNLGIGAYRYTISITTALGETDSPSTAAITTVSGSQQVTVSWTASTDYRATGYKIYRTPVGGQDWQTLLLTTIVGASTTSYTDNIADGSLTGVSGVGTYHINSTAKHLTIAGTRAMVIDARLVALGTNTGVNLNGGGDMVLIGTNAGRNITTAVETTLVGQNAGQALTTGTTNQAFGYQALIANVTGSNNVIIGHRGLWGATSGNNNTTLGYDVLYGNGSSGYAHNQNLAVGFNAGYNLQNVTGTTLIGYQAGYTSTTGDNNLFIGYKAGYYETGSNKFFIDNQVRANEADARIKSLFYGVFASTVASQSLVINAGLTVNYNATFNGKTDFGTTGQISISRLSSDPGSPANGDMWYNTTSNTFKCYQNGAVKTFTVS